MLQYQFQKKTLNQIITITNKKDFVELKREMFKFNYVIGKRGFGKVWQAIYRKSKEKYALKEMSKVKIIDRRSEISIMSERNLLSKLNHPFIVNMYFAFQDFWNLYLVMDLLTGGDLRFHIAHQKTFTEMQTKFFISNMLLALEYIHSQNIIHHDIKPENLVLESTGYLRITDFGVAKINELDNSSETSGTPGYMAPEVILVQNHSFPSDFFALGVIGYEFMLGYRPYLGRGRKEIKHLIIAKQAKLEIEEIPDDWSDESRDFINLLLQRKPKKRLGYNGVKEIKDHPWMNDINWELLMQKKMDAPFIPPSHKENFDKKYCEGEDEVGETTIERYDLYYQSELYGDVFKNYTFVNMGYVKKYSRKRNHKKLKILNSGSSINLSNSKIQSFTIDKDKNLNYNYNINKKKDNQKKIELQKCTIDYDTNLKLNKTDEENNLKFKGVKNIGGNNENINNNLKLNNEKIEKIEKINIINNNELNKNTKTIFSKNYGKSSVSTNNFNYKYNSPLVNENIICNNYINFNFNNYQSNTTKTKKTNPNNNNNYLIDNNNNKIDMTSLKNLLNNNESNDINLYNSNEHENNNYSQHHKNSNLYKTKISKSSSMKFINDIDNINNININNNPVTDKKKTKIILIKKINQENIDNNYNHKIIKKNEYKITPIRNNKLTNEKKDKDKVIKGSDYNLKIDTNYLDIFSIPSKYNNNNRQQKEKTLSKTTSSEKINIGNNIKIRNTELDKINQWINKNIINNNNNTKNTKINNNNFPHQYSTINIAENYYNNCSSLRKFHKTNSMINISSDNTLKKEYLIKNRVNQNFPNINIINSPKQKKTMELNTININTNSLYSNHQSKKRSFNTINNTNLNLNKVHSLKNIHGPTINNNNPNFDSINPNSPPISFNFFNFNNNQKTRNKNKNRNLFNKNMNLNFGFSNKISSKNYRINPKINSFNLNHF